MGLLIEMTSPTWGYVELWGRGWQWGMGRMCRDDAEHIGHDRFFGGGQGDRQGGGRSLEAAMGRFCIWMAYGPQTRMTVGGAEADPAIGLDLAA